MYFVYSRSVKDSGNLGMHMSTYLMSDICNDLREFEDLDLALAFMEHDPCRALDGSWITTYRLIEGKDLSFEKVIETEEVPAVTLKTTTTYKIKE